MLFVATGSQWENDYVGLFNGMRLDELLKREMLLSFEEDRLVIVCG